METLKTQFKIEIFLPVRSSRINRKTKYLKSHFGSLVGSMKQFQAFSKFDYFAKKNLVYSFYQIELN